MQTLLFPLHAFLSEKKKFKGYFFFEYERTVLLTVYFSLEIRSSINFSPKITYEASSGLILQRLPCSISLALYSLSYIGSFYVWQFLYYQISFQIRFPPSHYSVLLSVCSLFLFLSDSSPISEFGLAFVSYFLVFYSPVSFSCSFT